MAALTLIEAAKLGQGTQFERAVTAIFARSSEVLEIMPFREIPGNALRYNVESKLPSVGFRGVNEAWTPNNGVLNPITESLSIAGGDIEVDTFILTTEGMDQRAVHESMKIAALAEQWTRKFIKGDSESDPREFDGLQKRIGGLQLIPAGATSGGDALSLFLLDKLIAQVIGENKQLLMNRQMWLRMTQASRKETVAGHINFVQDEMGRTVAMYNGHPIRVLEDAEGEDTILPFNEANPGGGAAASTSIYCVSFGEGRLHGIQNGRFRARDLGEHSDRPVFTTRIEWYAGMVIKHGRSVGRLHGIKDDAIVA